MPAMWLKLNPIKFLPFSFLLTKLATDCIFVPWRKGFVEI